MHFPTIAAFFASSAVFLFLSTSVYCQQPQPVDELLCGWDRPDSPGFIVAVMKNGKQQSCTAFGMANIEAQQPLKPTTPLCVMSVSKSFASACFALAMDLGHFAPDDDIRRYVPELQHIDAKITVRHLLTCRSGLRDFYFSMALLGRDVRDAYTSDDVLDVIVRQKRLMFPPGAKWSYSNSDWFLLDLIVQRTTGKTLHEFSQQHVFVPLKMKQTRFQDAPLVPLKGRASGHGHNGTTYTRLEPLSDAWGAAGGLWTTVNDIQRWENWLRSGTGLPKGKHIAEFRKTGSLLGNENSLSVFPNQTYRGIDRIWYTGAGVGFLAHYVRFPTQGLAIVVLGNNSTDRGWHASVSAVHALADHHLRMPDDTPPAAKSKRDWPAELPTTGAALSTQRLAELQNYMGVYRRADGDYVELTLTDGAIQLSELSRHWQYGYRHPLHTIATNKFRLVRGYDDFQIEFEVSPPAHQHQTSDTRPNVASTFADGRQERWAPVSFASLDPKRLQSLAGEYYCDDLESVYRVSITRNQLFIQYNFGRKRLHRGFAANTFLPAAEQFCIPIRFTRGDDGVPHTLTATFGRAGELTFRKRDVYSDAQ